MENRKNLIVTKDDIQNNSLYYGLFYHSLDRVISKMYILKQTNETVLCYDFAGDRWQEIEYSRFHSILNGTDTDEELSQVDSVDALWFLEMHHAFNGEGNDAKVEMLLSEWTEKKEKFWSEFNCGWPAKYVETTFYLGGKQYSITPDSIGLKRGDPWDEGFMEFLQSKIGDDLQLIGATEIRHMGFLD